MKIANTSTILALTLLLVQENGVAQAISTNLRGMLSSSVDECSCGNGKAKIWGPGGPHTALLPVADLFNAQQRNESAAVEIEICFGPEKNWRDQAMQCASGFMAAAEQQAAGFARVYGDILDAATVGYGEIATPLTMHKATLLVAKGNPKNISSLDDILSRDDVGVVVVDGNYHETITSGTGLWEDVLGRTKNMQDTAKFREHICHVASGGGDGRNQMLNQTSGCDAWIYWNDWAVANGDIIDEIELPDELVIYRGLTVMPTTNEGGDVVQQFINFALTSIEADEAMEEAGWFREF